MNPDTYVAPVVNKFLDMAQRHMKYVVSSSSYTRNLQKKKEVLDAKKKDIIERIVEGERRSQRPTNEVVVWRDQAIDMLDRIDTALNKAQETRSCVCWICSKHKIGRSCADMIKEVDELLERASLSNNMEMLDCDTSNIAIPMPYVVADSQQSYFVEACKCIEDGNSNANIIGIWGIGGVGKTTLLTKIHNHFIGTSSMFETVIWVVASSEQSNIYKVQSEIVKNLRLNKGDDVQSQARLIKKFLENKNFLLFIDDLWEEVELHEVGVPNPKEGNQIDKKRKVIFTTRSTNVCSKMETGKKIEVKCLDFTQSLILFKEKVGEEVIQFHPVISKLAEDISKECQGLPLALVTIGRAMSTKSNVNDWKYAINQLKNSQGLNDLGVEKQLLRRLKISYDYLATDRLRKCFLTISMWPEDRIIKPEELIEFWMGTDVIDIDNLGSKYKLYQFGHSLIRSLQAACLLEDVENYYNDKMVKMHDVLRDLALWLSSDCGENKNKWMVKAGLQLQKACNMKVEWREAECISLMYNEIKGLPSDIPTSPSLLTLVLKGNKLNDESKLNCLCKFQSLTHLDLSMSVLYSFPESICDLTELRYLNLSYNRITDLPLKLGNLKGLRYLILRRNKIRKIARGLFAELAELLVLDMFDAIDIRRYPAVEVEELKSIENKLLSFGTSVGNEEELRKLMLLSELPIDALWIEGLDSTTFHFMSMIRNPDRLMELRIEIRDGGSEISDDGSEISDGDGSEISEGGLKEIVFEKNETDQDIASLNLETLKLWNLSELETIKWKDIAPEILFVELQTVEIVYCRLLEDITWVVHLPSLKSLSIESCGRMRIAVNNEVDPQVLTFPSLQHLLISDCKQLEKISTSSVAFPQLKLMDIWGCPLLKELPLEVKTTPKLRKIRGEKEWWEKVEWEDDYSTSHFNPFFKG